MGLPSLQRNLCIYFWVMLPKQSHVSFIFGWFITPTFLDNIQFDRLSPIIPKSEKSFLRLCLFFYYLWFAFSCSSFLWFLIAFLFLFWQHWFATWLEQRLSLHSKEPGEKTTQGKTYWVSAVCKELRCQQPPYIPSQNPHREEKL